MKYCTVLEKEYSEPIKQTLQKWGYFERQYQTIKRCDALEKMLLQQKIMRTFQWDTVHPCDSRDCNKLKLEVWKNISSCLGCQLIYLVKGFRFCSGKYFFQKSNFNLLQFCSPLSHAGAQYLIWNSLQFLNWIVSIQEPSSTFEVWYLN